MDYVTIYWFFQYTNTQSLTSQFFEWSLVCDSGQPERLYGEGSFSLWLLVYSAGATCHTHVLMNAGTYSVTALVVKRKKHLLPSSQQWLLTATLTWQTSGCVKEQKICQMIITVTHETKNKNTIFGHLGQQRQVENTTLTHHTSNSCLYTHPAIKEQHYHSFGHMFVSTWWILVQ